MLTNNRVIFSDNGVLKDISVQMSNISTSSYVLPIVAAQDYLYIGSDLPFNHRYFEVSVVNANSCSVSVSIWDGNTWNAAVDILDQTSASNATLAQSGIISWAKDKDEVWGLEETTEDVTGLTTLKIYDMYWARIAFSADVTNTMALTYIGHKFADDNDLFLYYPDLAASAAMTTYKAGKTNWNEQHVMAAEEIILKLRKDNKVMSPSQILNWQQFNLAAVHKCAEIIFRGFGDDYKDNKDLALKEYYKALSCLDLDKDVDGKLDKDEKISSIGLYRT